MILLELLRDTRLLQAKDPHDVFFSMDSVLKLLLDKSKQTFFPIDYNMPAGTLFQDVTAKILLTVPDLGILSFVDHGVMCPCCAPPSIKADQHMPSWVPDYWSISQSREWHALALHKNLRHDFTFNAATVSTQIRRMIKSNVLIVNGYQIGTINNCVGVLQTTRRHIFLLRCLEMLKSLSPMIRHVASRYDAFWSTLVANIEGHDEAPADLGECLHDWILYHLIEGRMEGSEGRTQVKMCCAYMSSLSSIDDGATRFPAVSYGDPWHERLVLKKPSANDRKDLIEYLDMAQVDRLQYAIGSDWTPPVFSTKEGDIGRGNSWQKNGDQVWLLENGRVPFILRPLSQARTYILVGESYIHGIMHGELMRPNPPEWEIVGIV